MPVSHTRLSPSCSLGNFPQIRKRTVKRVCLRRRVFTIATQRTVERAFTSLQLHSLDQPHTSAPRRVASIWLPPMGSQIPGTQHRIPVIQRRDKPACFTLNVSSYDDSFIMIFPVEVVFSQKYGIKLFVLAISLLCIAWIFRCKSASEGFLICWVGREFFFLLLTLSLSLQSLSQRTHPGSPVLLCQSVILFLEENVLSLLLLLHYCQLFNLIFCGCIYLNVNYRGKEEEEGYILISSQH